MTTMVSIPLTGQREPDDVLDAEVESVNGAADVDAVATETAEPVEHDASVEPPCLITRTTTNPSSTSMVSDKMAGGTAGDQIGCLQNMSGPD